MLQIIYHWKKVCVTNSFFDKYRHFTKHLKSQKLRLPSHDHKVQTDKDQDKNFIKKHKNSLETGRYLHINLHISKY